MSEQMEKTKGKKGGKIAIAVCIVIIIVLLGVVIYLLKNRKEDGAVRRNIVVNKDNVDEVLENLQDPVPAGYYEVKMNTTWNFSDGSSPSNNAYVENVEVNTNSVYFDVIRADTEETIYESPILPVGSYLENITLDSSLSAGTYDCLLTYHLLNENDVSISTVTLTLTINIDK